jgi:hypothetical protein
MSMSLIGEEGGGMIEHDSGKSISENMLGEINNSEWSPITNKIR